MARERYKSEEMAGKLRQAPRSTQGHIPCGRAGEGRLMTDTIELAYR